MRGKLCLDKVFEELRHHLALLFQLAKNVGNASFNEILEADLQDATKPDPSSDM